MPVEDVSIDLHAGEVVGLVGGNGAGKSALIKVAVSIMNPRDAKASDRISVMATGKLVGTVRKDDVTNDEVLGMIILGKKPDEVSKKELDALVN